MFDSLFRDEVFEARRRRIYGDVVLRQSIPTWGLALLFGALLLGGLLALSFGNYARTETVQGILLTGKGAASIDAGRGGTIERIFVTEGQEVERGEPLLRIRSDTGLLRGGSSRSAREAIVRDQRSLIEDQIRFAASEFEQQDRIIGQRISGLRDEAANAAQQIALMREVAASARSDFETYSELAKQGFARLVDLENSRRSYLAAQAQVLALEKEAERLKIQLSQAEVERANLPQRTAERERVLQQDANENRLQMVEIDQESGFMVNAPVDGRVAGLRAVVGQAISPDQQVLDLLPADAELRAHLFVPSRSAGFLRIGQMVRLRYDAFPYQQFGSFDGVVEEVSRTVLDPDELAPGLNLNTPVYRVIVRPERNSIVAYGQTTRLSSGLTLTSSIVLEQRTLLDVLLDPIRAVRARN